MNSVSNQKNRLLFIQILSNSYQECWRNLGKILFIVFCIVSSKQILEIIFYKSSIQNNYFYSDIFPLPLFNRVTYKFSMPIEKSLNIIGACFILSIYKKYKYINIIFQIKLITILFICIIFIPSILANLFNVYITIFCFSIMKISNNFNLI